MSDESWVDKYRPTTFDEVQGNTKDLKAIKQWADDWSHGDSPILLAGEPGTGKTSTAEVVARYLGMEIEEINASDARKTDDVERMAGAIGSVGADGPRLLLIDEVDSWHHATRKQPLYDALDAPANPVILTCNDAWETPDGITDRAKEYEFKLQKRSRKAKLREIAEAEGVEVSDAELDTLADRPDLRSGINDLQIAAEQDLPPDADAREWDISEWDMVDQVLTGTPDIGSLRPDEALMWLEENTGKEYRSLELALAYEALSMADVQLGRAQESGYRHWKYARAMIEEVARIRVTEPHFEDHIGRKKSFPEWFRHRVPKWDGGSPEARLYRALKRPEEPGFEFAGGYTTFLRVYLPILEDLPKEKKCELILSYRLDPQQYEALGVTEAQYEDWVEVEAPEQGEWSGKVADATEW